MEETGKLQWMEPHQMERFIAALTARLDDHDLLIEMRTNQSNMLGEVRAMRQDQAQVESDHERRIRTVEKVVFYGMGAIAVLIVVLKFIKFS